MGRAVAATALLLGLLTGCGGSSTDDYCGTVKDDQQHLSTVLGDGGQAALLDALPIFRTLQTKAPDDIRDSWNTVVDRLAALQKALDDAHVDPEHYDAEHPPASVTTGQRKAIADAATALGSLATAQALNDVQQHARDVCHTPLSL